ncbi:MAG: site-specific DNA-methyltransferase [Armatimonadota bacterium]|nr:site-specific DNA-methyltransferase [Armatimonadota bacterium]
MTEEQRQEIIRLLQQGEDISSEWARILFPPEKREYELVYHGKQREEDILADTLAVPLQPVRTFGKNGDGWHNMLVFGDNLQTMKSLLEAKKAGHLCNADGTPGVRLVYIDPPFATKQEFQGSQDQKAYQDKVAGAQFVEFLRRRLLLIRELLAADGSVYVHLDQKKAHYAKVVLDEVFGEQNFRNEIIWRNTNTHNKAETFGQIHQSLFLFTRSPRFLFQKTFRPRLRRYVEAHYRHTDEKGAKFRYSDPTGDGIRNGESGAEWEGYKPTETGRHWAIPGFIYDLVDDDISKLGVIGKLNYLRDHGLIQLPRKRGGQPQIVRPESVGDGNPMQDLWAYQPYTQGAYAGIGEAIDEDVTWATGDSEATGYPTQKPEGLLSRVIRSSSAKGDIVLDAFAGSGTTCVVAEKLGRHWIGIDCGKLAIYTIQKRMLNLRREIGNKGPALKPQPFTLYNAGLYDFSKLKDLSWEAWRFFALQLFQCRDECHRIGGIELDGYLKGASVLVFNHQKQPGVRIDEETVRSLHEALGSRVGSRLFIIAPALTFDFQQDYTDLGGVRYYALRIPYSIIHELHQREFTALKQPSDELAVNDTVEAVGFDFVRTPQLEYECGVNRREGTLLPEAFIHIKTFKSEAVVRDPMRKKGNRETLSMVMLDYNYEADIFDLDAVFYADAIGKAGWEVRFPVESVGQQIMAVFIDIYGNEARELISSGQIGTAGASAAVTSKRDNKKKAGAGL